MDTLNSIFCAYKASTGLSTDDAMAQSLGVAKTAFSNYRNGRRRLPDVAIFKIADATGLDAREITAVVNANLATTSPEERHFWASRFAMFVSACTLTTLCVGIPQTAHAYSDARPDNVGSVYYVNLIRALLRWIATPRKRQRHLSGLASAKTLHA